MSDSTIVVGVEHPQQQQSKEPATQSQQPRRRQANPQAQQAPNGNKWITVPNRNIRMSKQGSNLVIVIDMESESDVATKRGVSYIAKLNDRTVITLDGVEYYAGLWLTEKSQRAASNQINL